MDSRRISGPLKAAILIRSLGKEVAAKIISSLTDEEKQVIDRHLGQIGTLSGDVIEFVAKEFTDIAAMRARASRLMPPAKPDPVTKGGQGEGEDKDEHKGLKAIDSLAAEEIYELIKDEHPQTIAIILIHLKTAAASDVLSRLSDEVKTDVAVRVANLDKVNAEMVEEVNSVFKEILKNKKSSVTNVSGGIDRLAEILNFKRTYFK